VLGFTVLRFELQHGDFNSVSFLTSEFLQSYDPTTHFETTVKDVLEMYTRITGKVGLPEHLITSSRDINIGIFSCCEA
jgi:hypothetical protein